MATPPCPADLNALASLSAAEAQRFQRDLADAEMLGAEGHGALGEALLHNALDRAPQWPGLRRVLAQCALADGRPVDALAHVLAGLGGAPQHAELAELTELMGRARRAVDAVEVARGTASPSSAATDPAHPSAAR